MAHVLIDAKYDPEVTHVDEARVARALNDLARVASLTIFHGPEVQSQGAVICGIVLFAESHATVHVDRESGGLWADVFSCKDVDHNAAIEVVKDVFWPLLKWKASKLDRTELG